MKKHAHWILVAVVVAVCALSAYEALTAPLERAGPRAQAVRSDG